MNHRHALRLLAAFPGLAVLCSCVSTIPQHVETAPIALEVAQPSGELETPSLPTVEVENPAPKPDPVPVAPETASPPILPQIAESDTELIAASYRTAYEESRLDDLLCEIDRRFRARWKDLSLDGPTDTDNPAEENPVEDFRERCRLGLGLIALSFLKEEEDTDAIDLEVVNTVRQHPTSGVEGKLLAAAVMERAGRVEERDVLLREIMSASPLGQEAPPETPSPPLAETAAKAPEAPSPAPPKEQSFRLRDVSFVSEISGLGSFTVRPDKTFVAGERVLIYGEFVGFHDRVDEDGENTVYSREFTASLQLVDNEQNVIDKDDFLKPNDGRNSCKKPKKAINFWARYDLPADLAPGRYGLEILAADLLSKTTDKTTLTLDVSAGGKGPQDAD